MRLVVTIPAYNEEATIAGVIREIPRTIPGITDVRVLVMNDGSKDRTSDVAREAGADEILMHAGNKGLAKTFQDGIECALAMGADIVVNTDADNHYDQSRIPELIAPILEGRADVVVGGREVDKLEDMKTVNRQGNKLGSWLVSRIIGRKDTLDVSTGFRAYNREAALHMHVFSRHTYTHETIIQALDQQLTVVEVPIKARPVARKSRLIKSLPSHIVRSLIVIFRIFTLYKPLRVMTIIGGIIFACGLAFIVRFFWFYFFAANGGEGHIQSLILASALIILGFQIFIIGLLASAIGWNRKLLEEILYRIKKEQTEHESPVYHEKTSSDRGGDGAV
ncbi:MAG: glycosyltransferase family 2 protein [Patescibacteria group bacterium]|jgi:glycosyltransferase involved in cell wall biosynthesis